jgi:hypothetical protein
MTISLKVSVNGNYKATIQHTIDGEPQRETVISGVGSRYPVETQISFQHGKKNDYSITEEYLGSDPK